MSKEMYKQRLERYDSDKVGEGFEEGRRYTLCQTDKVNHSTG